MRKAIFPGSFDPFTLGHLDVLKRSLSLFDEITVGIGKNDQKKTMFSEQQRIEFIKKCFKNESKIKVESYEGLTIDFCKKIGAKFIVRGIRNNGDFEFEKAIALTNRDLAPIETVFLLTAAKTSYISSSIVRDILQNGGDVSSLVPSSVITKIDA